MVSTGPAFDPYDPYYLYEQDKIERELRELRMGTSQSTVSPRAKEVEQSTGVHMFEFHGDTAVYALIIMGVIAGFAVLYCLRKCSIFQRCWRPKGRLSPDVEGPPALVREPLRRSSRLPGQARQMQAFPAITYVREEKEKDVTRSGDDQQWMMDRAERPQSQRTKAIRY